MDVIKRKQVEFKNRILVSQAKAGSRRAQKRLYELYSTAMFNTCQRITGSLETAEDVLQEAFTEAFMNIESFDFRVEFGAWLKKIVIYKSINAMRRNQVEWTELTENHDWIAMENDDNEEVSFTINKVMKAMHQLPDKARTIFSLYLLEGYDHEEISEIMGITISTSKTQLLRAKLKVKDIVKSYEYEY